jgi:lipopolysaccharide transport system permease protein
MMQIFHELIEYREFLREFTLQQFRSRYRGSVLGFLWTLLIPLLVFLTFAFVFTYLNRMQFSTFGPYFFGGYIAWVLFASATTSATTSISANSNFVTKVYVPKAIFPVSTFLITVVEFFGFVVAMFFLMPLVGAQFYPEMAFLPVSFLIMAPFVAGLCLLFAAITVFLRDFAFLWVPGSMLWFFCTPILYPMDVIPPVFRQYMEMNPILPFVRLFRDPIAFGRIPDVETLTLAVIYSALALILGTSIFARSQKSFYAYM